MGRAYHSHRVAVLDTQGRECVTGRAQRRLPRLREQARAMAGALPVGVG